MAIIKQTNKKTGVTYVYDSHSYWDKERKQHRSDRKLLGKIDPESGEIVPTRKKKEPDSAGGEPSVSVSVRDFEAKMAKKDAEIQTLRNKIGEMQKELKEKDRILDRIRSIIS